MSVQPRLLCSAAREWAAPPGTGSDCVSGSLARVPVCPPLMHVIERGAAETQPLSTCPPTSCPQKHVFSIVLADTFAT